MAHEFWVAFGLSLGAMFPIINPVGHAPMFYVMTEADTTVFRRRMATKTSIYTTLILITALFAGDSLLAFFGVSLDDMRIAGGLLVARAAWEMLGNTSRVSSAEREAACDKVDVSLTPMATPILAGPGAMSLAIGLTAYGKTPTAYVGYLTGFLAIGLITWISLHFSDLVVRVISPNALGALNRILGFFIMAIGVNLIVDGVHNLFFSES